MARFFLLINLLLLPAVLLADNLNNSQTRVETFSDDIYVQGVNSNFTRLFSGYQPVFTSTPTTDTMRDGELVISSGSLYYKQSGVVYAVSPQPVGTINQYGGSTAPLGWLLCNGSTVSRTSYASLFNIIGTTFGPGDGSTTFSIPNFQRRVAVGSGGTGTSALAATVGSAGGEETHVLTSGEMPSHSHSVTDPGHTHQQTAVQMGGGALGTQQSTPNTGSVDTYNFTKSNTTGISIGNTGSGTAHNVIQPSLVVNYIIKY